MRTRDLTTQTGTLDGFLRIPDIECAWRKKQMKNILLFGILTGILLLSGPARFDASQAASDGGRTLTGKWIVEADFYGTPLYFQMELNEESGKLSGKFGGRKLEGTVAGIPSILWRKTSRAERRSARRWCRAGGLPGPLYLRMPTTLRTRGRIRLRQAFRRRGERERLSGMSSHRPRFIDNFRR